MTLAIKSKTLRRCDLCHHATHNIYRVQLGDAFYQFCSGAHANTAANNYSEKVKQGLTPSIVPDSQINQIEENYE